MSADLPQFISVGKGDSARQIAVRHDERGAPGILWLSGFKSDMLGTKQKCLPSGQKQQA